MASKAKANNPRGNKLNGKGRPEEYTKAKAAKICEAIRNGSNINKIDRDPSFPSRNAIVRWMESHDDFRTDFRRASELRADWRADEIDAAIEKVISEDWNPQQARVVIDAHKHLAAVENSRYNLNKKGDTNVQVNVSQSDGALEALMSRLDTIANRPRLDAPAPIDITPIKVDE